MKHATDKWTKPEMTIERLFTTPEILRVPHSIDPMCCEAQRMIDVMDAVPLRVLNREDWWLLRMKCRDDALTARLVAYASF